MLELIKKGVMIPAIALLAACTIEIAPYVPNAPAESVAFVDAEEGHGSAVYLGNNEYLTAGHIANIEGELRVDGLLAAVVWVDETNDVALLRVEGEVTDTPARLRCTELEVGESLTIAGNPMFMRDVYTFGYVAGLYERGEERLVVMDASIAPGNSGGPVFDAQGQLVGIAVETAVWQIGMGGTFTGHSLAVPSSTFCPLLD